MLFGQFSSGRDGPERRLSLATARAFDSAHRVGVGPRRRQSWKFWAFLNRKMKNFMIEF